MLTTGDKAVKVIYPPPSRSQLLLSKFLPSAARKNSDVGESSANLCKIPEDAPKFRKLYKSLPKFEMSARFGTQISASIQPRTNSPKVGEMLLILSNFVNFADMELRALQVLRRL